MMYTNETWLDSFHIVSTSYFIELPAIMACHDWNAYSVHLKNYAKSIDGII